MVKVTRTRIIGTKFVSYAAYEPSGITGNHGTIQHIDGEWYGDISTRRISSDIDSLPAYSRERLHAVTEHYGKNYEECYAHIYAKYPHLREIGKEHAGEVSTWTEEEN